MALADLPPQPPSARRRRWRWLFVGAVLLLVLVIAGVAFLLARPKSGLQQLLDRDRAGGQACHMLDRWLRGELTDQGKPVKEVIVAGAISEFTSQATTTAIRRTAGQEANVNIPGASATIQFTNLRELHTACVEAGVRMAPYREP